MESDCGEYLPLFRKGKDAVRPEIYVLEAEVAGVISSMCAIHFGEPKSAGPRSGRIDTCLLAPSGVAPMLPEQARFANLLTLPEGVDIGKAINEAMKAIETENEDVKDVLPRTYNRLDKELLVSLSKNFTAVLMDIEGDEFGKDLRISPRQVRDVRRPKRR